MSPIPYRNALVTGASRGIGAAICRSLREQGLVVYAVARNVEALEKLAAETGVKPLVADVCNVPPLLDAISGVGIDVLVNNAGGLESVRPLHQQTADEVIQSVSLNLTAPLLLMRAILPGMIARKRGHVFNITSSAAHSVFAGTAVYGAAKAGLSHAGKVLRYDLAGSNVRITEISPGRVETEFYLRAFGGNRESLQDKMYRTNRSLRPEDVAAAVVAALAMPARADLAHIDLAPTDQAPGGYAYGEYKPE